MPTPGIEQFEKNISFTAVISGDSSIASVVTCDTGYAFEAKKVTGEAELVSQFGTPNNDNASDWFQAYNVLEYVGAVTVVRPIDLAKATKNLGVSFNLDDATGDTLTTEVVKESGLYNEDIFTITYDNIVFETVNNVTQKLKIFNRFVTSQQDIGIAIASDPTAFDANISTDIPVKFSSYFDVVPNFSNSEVAMIVFRKNIDGTFSYLEKWIVSYDVAGKDIYGKNIFIDNIINKSSKYLYAVTNTANDYKVNTDATSTLTLIESMDVSTALEWEATTAYSLDDLLKYNGYIYKCTTAGTSGADQTAWTDTPALNATETDGTVVWTVIYNTGDFIYPNTLKNNLFVYDGTGYALADIQEAFAVYEDPEEISVDVLISHHKGIDEAANIANSRKDCVAVVGPYDHTELVGKSRDEANTYLLENFGTVDYNAGVFGANNSTYVVVYGNMKYQYDKFNDKNRWLPLFGDVAGMIVLSEQETEPWYAAAGTLRGKLNNVIRLAFQPKKSNRIDLDKNSINAVIAIAGEGSAIVYGHKTWTSVSSAFDRLSVRRLMLTLEKTTVKSLRPFVFQFNDSTTRDRILGTLTPAYDRVQAKRGLYEYLIVCDESNNTPEVIDSNELVVDIYVKPTKTADYIKVNQIVTKTGVDFAEIIA